MSTAKDKKVVIQTEDGETVSVSSSGSKGEVWLQISEPYNSLSATMIAGEARKIEDALRKLREQAGK
jgi:hypothetical protein